VAAVAAFGFFWSAFSLLGMLFTRDSLWLVADGAAAAAAADAWDDSAPAGLRPESARLLRTPCTGPVLRARPFDGDTDPSIIHIDKLESHSVECITQLMPLTSQNYHS